MRSIRPRAALAALLSITGSLAVVACEGVAIDQPVVDGGTSGRDAGHVEDASAIGQDAGANDEVDAGTIEVDGGELAIDGGTEIEVDAGTAVDAGHAPTGVPIFVAQGYQDRTTISCDDGRTWIANRSVDDASRCFTGGLDCDHQAGRAKGLTYSRGHFVGTWGWGSPGAVKRSVDGRTWETTLTGRTFGGIAGEGGSALVLGANVTRHSSDDGASWSEDVPSTLAAWNVRRAGYAPVMGGRWILVGEDGGTPEVVVSSDGGETYAHPTALPASCGRAIQNDGGIGWAPGVIAIVGGDGGVCRSTDGGVTWSASHVGAGVSSSDVISTGTEMFVWGNGQRFRSTDGATWTGTAVSPAGTQIGAVERSAAGTFVAVNAGWDEWYERQRWYRSTDGVTWEVLPEGAALRSHPIHAIAHGVADPSACD